MTTAVTSRHPGLTSDSSPTNPLSSLTTHTDIRQPQDTASQLAPISPARNDEPDPRQSLQHVLASNDELAKSPVRNDHDASESGKSTKATKNSVVWIHEGAQERAEDEPSVQNDSYTRAAEVNPSYTMTVAHTRRNANGTVGSVYSGNKIRHLKKEDGIPLWRKDIQFAFLRAVFDDETRAFTMASDGSKGHTFSEIYIDAMARSSKTSKILKEKLLSERSAALNMAMVCLLVNVGRMNTTLNFFPEMRAQLRTYHSIPSLQAHQDPIAYKQLQDAPRLKSILKGASEDANQPSTIEKIKALPVPRTNPVNLIFVLSQYAPKISETHFHAPRDFFDLVMRGTLSSKSRANAFLWLIWFYLESDYSGHAATTNPFGPGQHGDATGGLPLKVPAFEHLTEEQANAENVDTSAEKAYGEMKRQERKRILEEDATVGPPLKKAKKGDNLYGFNALNEHFHSDTDRTRSPSPSRGDSNNLYNFVSSEYPVGTNGVSREIRPAANSGLGETSVRLPDQPLSQRLILKTRSYHPSGSSPGPARSSSQPPINHTTAFAPGSRRSRPETSHQKAVNQNRKRRIDYIIHRKLVDKHEEVRHRRVGQRRTNFFRAMRRIRDLPDDYASGNEDSRGPGGLLANTDEDEDYGEEAIALKKVLDRAWRRLEREENGGSLNELNTGHRKRKRRPDDSFTEENHLEPTSRTRVKPADGHGPSKGQGKLSGEVRDETLDDLDLDLLGEGRDEEQMDEELDDESDDDDSDDLTEEEAVDGR